MQFTILSLSMSGQTNLHEGNILYFGLKVCKKTGTKKVRQYQSSVCEFLLLTLRAYPGARFLVKSPDSVRVAKSHAREQHSKGDASARGGIGKGGGGGGVGKAGFPPPLAVLPLARSLVLFHRGSLTVRHTWRAC